MAKKNIIAIIGPCRSGTTWLQKAISIPSKHSVSYFQPYKYLVRTRLSKKSINPAHTIDHSFERIVIKEALGAFFVDEVNYFPENNIINEFVDREIKFIITMSDPRQCFESWIEFFSRVSSEHLWLIFSESYRTTLRTLLKIKNTFDMPILPISISKEAYPDNVHEDMVMKNVMSFCDIPHINCDFSNIIRWVSSDAFLETPSILNDAKEKKQLELKSGYSLPIENEYCFDELDSIFSDFKDILLSNMRY